MFDKPEMQKNLFEKRDMAVMFDSQKQNFLCKHCNISYKGLGTEGYVSIDKVQKCRIIRDDAFWDGKYVYLGFDLSQTEDNTAVAMVTYLDGVIYTRVMGFIPGERIEEKTKKEKFNYQRSADAGECIVCGGDVIDYAMVEEYILTLEKKLGVRVLYAAYDKYNALSSVQKIEAADDPIQCVEVMQHSRVLHPATKLLKEKILKGEFRYEENRLLENNFSNARCTEDTNLNKYVNKKRSAGKVDMVVALINAVYLVNEYEVIGGNAVGCTVIEW
jgi:phage terminase large subunit-like protein